MNRRALVPAGHSGERAIAGTLNDSPTKTNGLASLPFCYRFGVLHVHEIPRNADKLQDGIRSLAKACFGH